jgi:two-component system sensor histidine kinase KdpD
MIYLLGVFLVAIRFGRGASILAAVQSAGSFAYFFAPPLFSFAVSDTEHLIGLAVMLIVAIVTSSLMAALRSQAAMAAEGERRASALYRLSKELAGTRQEAEVISAGIRQIQGEFGCANRVLLTDGEGRLQRPDGETLSPVDIKSAQERLAHAPSSSLPNAESPWIYWPLTGSEGTLGVWLLENSSIGRCWTRDEETLLDTFLHQIAQSLERVRATEQARRTAIRMETETLRNSLLSAISHDLKTPLSTLVGASGTLVEEDGRLEAGQRRALLRTIHEDAQRMSDLTHKILDMARLEAGPVVLNRQWYALEEIVGSALQRMRNRLEHRTVNVDLADGLTLVCVDAVLMQQVLVNLLENALKYAPTGPIEIAA